MDRMLFVSADSHIVMPPEAVSEYLETGYQSLLPTYSRDLEAWKRDTAFLGFTPEALEVLDRQFLVRSGGDCPWNLHRRLAEMDREGVAAEIMFPGDKSAALPFFWHGGPPYRPDVRLAGIRAYHRFLADFMADAKGRLFAVADPGPCVDIEETVADLRWVATHGCRSVTLPADLPDAGTLPPLSSSYYEPFWATCAELDLALSIHAGHGGPNNLLVGFADKLRAILGPEATPQQMQTANQLGLGPRSPFAVTMVPQQVLWELLLGGVFDRYPTLKLVFTEVRADWVPATLKHLDECFIQGDTPLARKPSEYWESNCMAGASSIKRSEVRLRHQIGVHKLMFGRDFPHREGTWPNTWDWLRDALSGVPLNEARLILGENAVACYGLDRPALVKVAEKIGPRPEDILGDQDVDSALLANFNDRAGYERSCEAVDLHALDAVMATS